VVLARRRGMTAAGQPDPAAPRTTRDFTYAPPVHGYQTRGHAGDGRGQGGQAGGRPRKDQGMSAAPSISQAIGYAGLTAATLLGLRVVAAIGRHRK